MEGQIRSKFRELRVSVLTLNYKCNGFFLFAASRRIYLFALTCTRALARNVPPRPLGLFFALVAFAVSHGRRVQPRSFAFYAFLRIAQSYASGPQTVNLFTNYT